MGGFANDGADDVMYADNVDFSGNSPETKTVTTNGQLLIGSTAAPNIRVGALGSSDGSITWTVGAGTITGQVTGGTTSVLTLTGNSGGAISPTAGNINIVTANSTATLVGSGSTLTLDFNPGFNTSLILGSPGSLVGTLNSGFGVNSLAASLNTSGTNSGFGANSLNALTSGQANSGFGANALLLSNGSSNTACGVSSLDQITTGSNNTALGNDAGGNLTLANSSNIMIKNAGTAGDNNTIRIGTQGSGAGQQNQCFIAGIAGISNSNNTLVTQNSSTAQLGATTSTYPNTNAISTLLYASSANVMAALPTANSASLVTNSTGVPAWTASMTNGQMVIGSTGATPVPGTITSTGGTITVSTGAGTLNLEVAGGGFTWVDATSSTQALAVETGYVTNRGAGVTYTLPATATLGSIIKIVGKLGLATITPNANQQILIGSSSGAVGVTGTAVANNVGDCIELIAITAGASTVWRADSVVGTWTLTT